MIVNLTNREIEMIEYAIYVAQTECQLPETDESEEIRNLLEKLGLPNKE